MKPEDYMHLFTVQPCSAAVEWLAEQPDIATAWEVCERGNWMWWALCHTPGRLPTKEQSVAFARWCAARAATDAARAATDAAYAATDAAYATAAAADADDAAAYAAYAAADADDADAYADDAYADAYAEIKAQADWIREHIENPFLEK